MKSFTHLEIVEIIDKEMKRNMDAKNKYIKLNGFNNNVAYFDNVGAELSRLLYLFKEESGKK